MYKILTLNNISVKGLQRLPRERYEVASEISHPAAVLLNVKKYWIAVVIVLKSITLALGQNKLEWQLKVNGKSY